MKPSNIFVVVSHPFFRYGLVSILQSYPEFKVAGEASNFSKDLSGIVNLRPDVIIMDTYLDNDGADVVSILRQLCPSTRVMVLTESYSANVKTSLAYR